MLRINYYIEVILLPMSYRDRILEHLLICPLMIFQNLNLLLHMILLSICRNKIPNILLSNNNILQLRFKKNHILHLLLNMKNTLFHQHLGHINTLMNLNRGIHLGIKNFLGMVATLLTYLQRIGIVGKNSGHADCQSLLWLE